MGDGLRHRLEALWDTTPIVNLVFYGLALIAVLIGGLLFLTGAFGDDPADESTLAGTQTSADQASTSTPTTVAEDEDDGRIDLSALNPFLVVGSEIVDPYGEIFVPVGTNAAIRATDYAYVFDGGNGGVNGQVEAIQEWSWNTIRANLRCYDETGVPAQSEVIEGIAETVDELTQAGIVVILACHDSTGTDLVLDGPIEIHVRSFWDQVTEIYADNPYVWFNFFNEPFTTARASTWNELHRFYYDRYRDQGIDNIMIFDLPVYGQAIDVVLEDDFVDELANSCNTILGWHAWGAIRDRQASDEQYHDLAEAALDKDLAVLIAEAGVPDPLDAGTAGTPEWNESGYYAALDVAREGEIGMLWWHGTGDTSDDLFYPLKTDRTGFWTASSSGNLTPAGSTFWEYSHRFPGVKRFDGNVADSRCPSAVGVEYDS